MWWLTNARHLANRGHWPEWYGQGGLMACLRCIRGGKSEPFFRPTKRDPRPLPL